MILLTNRQDGTPVYASPEHIMEVYLSNISGGMTTIVSFGDSIANVTESPEEVVRKIMEYKEAKTKFEALATAWANVEDTKSRSFKDIDFAMDNWHGNMKRLAGLEESTDAQ